MVSLTFAYYCSGHGYGHATRVSAVTTYLCQMDCSPTVFIVSSAPKHVFAQAVSYGALYRYAEIDPVIVQPLAYHVDRRKSVDVLKKFLYQEERKIDEELAWLEENEVDCVLSDAAFLACKAANAAHIPSALITNFTFDSVYSYLSIKFSESSSPVSLLSPNASQDNEPVPLVDEPISPEELEPLVNQLVDGYRCAELLVRLPGNIPIPSFSIQPTLPSHLWTDPQRNSFHPEIQSSLRSLSSELLHPSISFPITSHRSKPLPRKVVQSPLIVRHPSADAYTSAGRKRLLDAVEVQETKVLIVSFGGQVFRKPSSRTPSRSHSPISSYAGSASVPRTSSAESASSTETTCVRELHEEGFVYVAPPVATHSHLWAPGAPPANKTQALPTLASSKHIPHPPDASAMDAPASEPEAQFLPDSSWIAIVCGATPVSKDILTALGDVLLGKLGYGTVAECVSASTPLVFVPRPLFVEEHGLRRLLHEEGTGIELEQMRYESGDWADYVRHAWETGREKKNRRRARGAEEDEERRKDGKKMAHGSDATNLEQTGRKEGERGRR
ncbi:hypothetical protein DFH11DRAFT_1839473 [Phellopilus nigrolimitatus]|nr:hypothetical protein DFH11DRAFT_1839473 [Phellopilus nigrolimitatus]